ncbi:MAG: deoxyhypusine synthase family protein [Elusimicrobia bacterium]|nr:deoxyhypusine synthase family protein [Elusimicrobiota bacterium]
MWFLGGSVKFIRKFVDHNYRHFNAAALKNASRAYVDFLDKGGKMFMTLAGAMSTAEIGLSFAEMIRKNKVHAISCTGANLEEDIFNLVAHNHYKLIPNYRYLSTEDEVKLLKGKYNRVTDTCIPEEEAFRRIEKHIIELWTEAEVQDKRHFPYEYIYKLIRRRSLKKHYQINPKDSWLVAACEKNLPIFTPGWEDSTIGNIFAANILKGKVKSSSIIKSGIEQMIELIGWYKKTSLKNPIGFFQIGGGIAGDFPICVVPLIEQDLKTKCRLWSYFCQISDSTTSYGSYSGAVPNEKITWGKLGPKTPSFIIESDASIVAPIMFGYILDN